MTETIVELKNITKSYGSVVAVDDVSLVVSQGEFVVLPTVNSEYFPPPARAMDCKASR